MEIIFTPGLMEGKDISFMATIDVGLNNLF